MILSQESGVVSIGDMARRFKLGSELMQATITARLGSAINGRLESGILYTPMYLARIKSQVRVINQASLSHKSITTKLQSLASKKVLQSACRE